MGFGTEATLQLLLGVGGGRGCSSPAGCRPHQASPGYPCAVIPRYVAVHHYHLSSRRFIPDMPVSSTATCMIYCLHFVRHLLSMYSGAITECFFIKGAVFESALQLLLRFAQLSIGGKGQSQITRHGGAHLQSQCLGEGE